ncbi:MAG: DUF58 domain-containing protein [Lachnospiraceae bacterium]|nr:DUF58 domain-containing protein [Lachnospiraceae bacterium]
MRLLLVIAIGLLLYLIQRRVYKKYWLKGLQVNIDFEEPVVREGDKNALIEVIKNDKALLLPVIQLKFSITRTFLFPKERNSAVTDQYYRNDYFSCRPFQIITRKYIFKATKRGEYKITSIDIICKDIFMDKSNFATSDEFSSVLVLPYRIRREDMRDDIIRYTGDVVKRIKLNEDPFEFRAIREYQPYDPMNHINWKATAKSDNLHVNTFNSTNRKNVVLLLNLDMNLVRNSEDLAEWSIRIASCLADRFIEEQIPVALYTNGTDYESDEAIGVDAGCDDGHIRNIDIALARILVKDTCPSFIKLLDDHIDYESDNEYIIISNYRKNDFAEKFDEIKKNGANVSVIIPDYGYADISPFYENGSDTFKWVIENEK